jgi:hypothetical protein
VGKCTESALGKCMEAHLQTTTTEDARIRKEGARVDEDRLLAVDVDLLLVQADVALLHTGRHIGGD